MARPRKSIPTVQHHKASGQAKVRIRGQDIYLGRWGSKEAREAYARIVAESSAVGPDIAQAAKQAAQATASVTVAELCLLWLDHAELTYTKNGRLTSHVGTFRTVIRVLRQLYGSTPAERFGPLALEAVRGEFVRIGHSRNTANRYCGNVRKIFRWGASRELVPATVATALGTLDPLRSGRTIARDSAPVLPIDDATIDATVAKLSKVVSDMVKLQRVTGMRPGEVCNLRPGDIDRTGKVWKYSPSEHKSQHKGRSRIVYIGPRGQAILLPYLLRAADAFCFSPREAAELDRAARHARRKTPIDQGNRPGSKPLKKKPIRQPGEKYTANTYRVAIVRACERAFGMPKGLSTAERTKWRRENCWHPNRLRHSFGTEAREAAGIEGAQVVLGHAQLNTSEIYAEKSEALATVVALRIG